MEGHAIFTWASCYVFVAVIFAVMLGLGEERKGKAQVQALLWPIVLPLAVIAAIAWSFWWFLGWVASNAGARS